MEQSLPPQSGVAHTVPKTLVWLLGGLALLGTAWWTYERELAEVKAETFETITAAAEVKAAQVAQWRAERLVDAGVLATSMAALQQHVPPQELTAERDRLLSAVRLRLHSYQLAAILDEREVPIAPQDTVLEPATHAVLGAARTDASAHLSSPFVIAGRPYLDTVCAIRGADGRATGYVLLRTDLDAYLFPFVQRWPTRSASAETLLVGPDRMIFNRLRHGVAEPLSVTLGAGAAGLALAERVDPQGPVETRDYRGTEVYALARPIHQSPWTLVAKADTREVRLGALVSSIPTLIALSALVPLAVFAALSLDRRLQMQTLKRAEATARDAVEQFNLAMRATYNVIWDYDIRTGAVWRNRAFHDIHAPADRDVPTDMEGWGELVHPEDRSRVRAGMGTALRSSETRWQDTYRFRRPDGSYGVIEDRAYIVRDAGGEPIRMVGAMQDVTQREEHQRVLQLQSAALHAAANAIVIVDATGAIVWTNRAFTTLTGYESHEVLGRNPRVLKSGTQSPDVYATLWRTVLAGEVWTGELMNRRKDGTIYPERQTITPLRDPGGRVTHFISIKQDLTDQKRLETQFLQSQKLEVVGRLAGGIAHDFNNLLTVINMTAEMSAAAMEKDDPVRGEMTAILRAGERAAALTRQLLAFSRRQVLQTQVIEIGALVHDMESMLRRLIGEAIDFTVKAVEPLSVRADPGQVEQVVLNLAVNARDAMPDGGALLISVGAREVDAEFAGEQGIAPGSYVVLDVSDTGIGMDATTRSRIFEPFFSTKAIGSGTGLGLATVYGIVKQSGGTITVYSEPTLGTTFRVYLPRVKQPQRTPAHPPSAHVAAAHGTETILVVEDEAPLRDLATRMLRGSGYTVLAAGNAEEALSVIGSYEGSIDLMLTDVVMPGLDGRKLAEIVTASRPAIRVLYTSGYTDDAILRHGVLEDVSRFISKPYSRADLTRKVREILDATASTA